MNARDRRNLLADILGFLQRFLVMPEDQFTAFTLWLVHTHCFESAEATPYLAITSPTKGCGKTQVLTVASVLARDPWGPVVNPTSATLFRKIGPGERPTFLLDEVDQARISGDIRAVLNAGYKRVGGTVPRVERLGGISMVCDHPVFCAKALSGIGRPLPATLMDRSIPIRMLPARPDESVERFVHRKVEPQARPLRDRMEAFADAHTKQLARAEPEIPSELSSRAAEIWEPLIAIGDLCGGGWPERARRAAVNLTTGDNAPDRQTALILDLRPCFDPPTDDDQLALIVPARDKMFSTDLVTALRSLDDPAAGDGYAGLTALDLASRLRSFGVQPKQIRIGGTSKKGYAREQFEDLWRRYPPPGPETANGAARRSPRRP